MGRCFGVLPFTEHPSTFEAKEAPRVSLGSVGERAEPDRRKGRAFPAGCGMRYIFDPAADAGSRLSRAVLTKRTIGARLILPKKNHGVGQHYIARGCGEAMRFRNRWHE